MRCVGHRSGLLSPTWPQCFPEVPRIHQAVEFGNRMITFAVVITAAVLVVISAHRRTEGAGVRVADAGFHGAVGGDRIAVRTGLLWWTVAVHLLASMTMVWLAVLLYVKIGETGPRRGDRRGGPAAPLRLTALSAVTLAAVLVTGTLVAAAGPHAGDTSTGRAR